MLLPTPNAYESTPTEEYVEETREHMADPHERLYLPGRKWHAQRTLSRIAPVLLPTPTHRDEKGETDPNRQGGEGLPNAAAKLLPTPAAADAEAGIETLEARKARGAGGSGLSDLSTMLPPGARLLPTPLVDDASNVKRTSGKRPFQSLAGETHKLLPTPTAADDNRNLDTTYAGGNPTLQAAVYEETALLPTPMAHPENPATGGELRAAIVHGPGRRNETGIDTLGRPNNGRTPKLLPTPNATDASGPEDPDQRREDGMGSFLRSVDRLLPTPQEADGERTTTYQKRGNQTLRGASMSPPSDDGSCSPDPPPGQLTMLDG